jgi:hypothetical protein
MTQPEQTSAADIIDQHTRDKSPVLFAATGLNVGFQSYIIKSSETEITIANTIPPEYITRLVAAKSFTMQLDMSLLSSQKIKSDGVNIVIPRDTLELISDHRRSTRRLLTTKNEAFIELINPIDNRTVLRKNLIDISEHGLSFRNLNNSLLFQAEQVLQKLTVKLKDKNLFYQGAKVVYNRRFFTAEGRSFYQVGLEFTK